MKFYKAGRLERLRGETAVKQAEYRALSAEQKIARLDERLGVGVGAKKERARIANAPTPAEVPVKRQKLPTKQS